MSTTRSKKVKIENAQNAVFREQIVQEIYAQGPRFLDTFIDGHYERNIVDPQKFFRFVPEGPAKTLLKTKYINKMQETYETFIRENFSLIEPSNLAQAIVELYKDDDQLIDTVRGD